jgi:DNA polymerase eta
MLSAKSFRPSINTFEQAVRWLRIFAADIFSRLVEEGVLENRRRPKTINLHHRHGGQTRSRQGPIPQGKILDESALFELAKGLLSQIVAEGNVWPCANLSLSVGGFEDGVTGNMGISAFLVKGEAAQALKSGTRGATQQEAEHDIKRRRVEDVGIQRFFAKRQSTEGSGRELGSEHVSPIGDGDLASTRLVEKGRSAFDADAATAAAVSDEAQAHNAADGANHVCARCQSFCETAAELQSHNDWHFAKDLQEREERVISAFVHRPSACGSGNKTAAASPKRAGRPKKTEPGQSKLKFG